MATRKGKPKHIDKKLSRDNQRAPGCLVSVYCYSTPPFSLNVYKVDVSGPDMEDFIVLDDDPCALRIPGGSKELCIYICGGERITEYVYDNMSIILTKNGLGAIETSFIDDV